MIDVICLGETMAMVTPANQSALHHTVEMTLSMGGAESNVALGLAAMGVPVSWMSRVGNDDFGQRICAELNAGGVDTALVEVDPVRGTGLYVKSPEHEGVPARVLYYRQGSAASAMDLGFLRDPARAKALSAAKLLHVSGITAAISDSCMQMLREVMARPRSTRICFDVNWRGQLWQDRDASALVELANGADIVMLGLDEAELAFGTVTEEEIRALLPGPSILVLKNEATSTVALTPHGRFEVPALRVQVVEPVGAGDSFAAGFLSGLLAGLSVPQALRRGHLAAACTLTVRSDRGELPPTRVLDALLELDESQWRSVTVAAEGISVLGEQIYRKVQL